MAYKIYYPSAKQSKQNRHKGRILLLTIGFFALFLLTAWHLIPTQLEALRQILLPQNQVDTLLQDLREGETIADAVSAFCQGIFDGS